MKQPTLIPSDEKTVGALIQLARVNKLHRMILAGATSGEILIELHRRGYMRATTTKICREPSYQFDVALVAAGEPSFSTLALDRKLEPLARYLTSTGVLVVWIGSEEHIVSQMLGSVLQRLGFRIESGTRCEQGIAVAARRLEACLTAQVA